MKFTEEEIRAAKKTRDVIIKGGTGEAKAVYMAGEICMWDELQNSAMPDVSNCKHDFIPYKIWMHECSKCGTKEYEKPDIE